MPTGPGSPPSGFSLLGKAHRMWAVPTARSGGMAFSAMGDVMGEWQQCRAGQRSSSGAVHCGHTWPGFGGGGARCSHTPSHSIYVGADSEDAGGRLLEAGLSRGRLPGVGPPYGRLLSLAVLRQLVAGTSRLREGGALVPGS